MLYSSIDYFLENFGTCQIPEDKIELMIKKASREINNYLVIKPTSLEELTPYEFGIFNDTCCELAIFLYKNNKYTTTVVNSLSIAGTSYSFDTTTAKSKMNDILISLD